MTSTKYPAILLSLVVLTLAACSGDGDSAPTSRADENVLILEREACFGTCPAYRVEVTAAGLVRWTGRSDVAVAGIDSAWIARDSVSALWEEFGAVRAAFPARYLPDWITCFRRATDNPTLTIIGRQNAEAADTLTHYFGCRSWEPQRFIAYEDRIDRALGTERWIGRARGELP